MFTIAQRHFINLKTRQRTQQNVSVNLDLIPGPVAKDDELLERLQFVLAKLPVRWQELLDLLYSRDQTKKQVAKSMGISLATCKRWHNSALAMLRCALLDPFMGS